MFESNTLYNLVEIDASDIWFYERQRFYNSDQNDNDNQFIETLYSYIQIFFNHAKCEPVIKFGDIDSGKISYDYYKNNLDRASSLKDAIANEMYIVRSDIYSLTTECIVRKNEFNTHGFEKLFALKLSQYHDGLSFLDEFLNFQLDRNFERNISDFKRFLNNILVQYDDLIDKKINAKVIKWTEEAANIEFSDLDKGAPDSTQQDDLSSPAEQPESGSENTSLNTNEENTQTEKSIKIPEDYIKINGKFSLEEIQFYFSFLYKEISEDDRPFLKKEDVMEIFKFGIAIPPKPMTKKYKLNCGAKYPKNIVEYCIYIFYLKYSFRNKEKKDVLRFFAYYFADFEYALTSPQKFQAWCNNVTGDEPKLIKFDINIYLPDKSK